MANEDWMAGFTNRRELQLTDITIPASHDAGVSEAPGCAIAYTKLAAAKDYIAQEFDIAGQLDAGSRFFDLRIATKSGELRTFHGEGVIGSVGGGWGQKLSTILQQVDTFLTNHTGEIVILRISHTKERERVHSKVTTGIHPSRLYRHVANNIAEVPLPELRGKAITIFDSGALANPTATNGHHRFEKYTPTGGRTGLVICGKYAGQQANMRQMVQEAISSGNKHATHPKTGAKHDHLFMVYWQLALDVKNKTTNGANPANGGLTRIDDNKGVHFNLDYLLNMHRAVPVYHVSFRSKLKMKMAKSVKSTTVTRTTRYAHRPNIINLDFINEDICNKVIQFNQDLLPPPLPAPRG